MQIDILSIEPRQNWGYTRIRPLVGTLPEDFPITKMWHSTIDRQRGVATLPIGIEIELAPFFGVMGVAPPPAYGACSSIQPREFGGNMDLKELVAGTTLYLPVWAPGALFSVGDGHGVQGDGEVCITALETALSRLVPADRAQGSRASSCRAPRRRRTTSRWRSTRTSTTRRRTRCAR